ncbi:NAD(P)-binding domain-containing protein, partial [Clostridium sp. SL.3.18]|nr:NAD(P)-binding domain-containing protein [Clostridium sp. SL.3.18]
MQIRRSISSTAGSPVDAVLSSLVPSLEPGDVIFDGGNSYYKDTNRRCHALEEKGIRYVGCGISGGRLGALYGPSI